MRKIWEKIKKDCKGAVTVIVTLLLIPAVLISGTGVDLTRAYAAKSIAQDANQLAANSLLASYDAMLQDLYGLFGMMQKDPEFKGMVEHYVDISLNGDGQEKGMGTFQLFYGSGVTVGDPEPAEKKNLHDPEVLRRQIEEYAKYRAPVIIVEEVIQALDAFEKIKKDADIVKQKMDIDEKVEEIDKIYKKIYECINGLNKAETDENDVYSDINECIDKLQEEVKRMSGARDDYTTYFENDDMEMANDYLKKFEGCAENIGALISGGTRKLTWNAGYLDDEGNFQSGRWTDSEEVKGSINILKDAEELFTNYISGDKNSLKALRSLCEEADSAKQELSRMVDRLESDLNKGECSEQLRKGMTDKDSETGKSTLDTYRDLLQYNLTAMANAMIAKDEPQLRKNIDKLLEIGYGDKSVGDMYFYHLNNTGLHNAVRNCTVNDGFYGQQEGVVKSDALGRITYGVDPLHYSKDGTFVIFQNINAETGAFYKLLHELYGGTDNNDKDSYEGALKTLIRSIQKSLKDIFLYEPEGAYVFTNKGATSDNGNLTDVGSDYIEDKDWGNDPGVINDAMSDSILTRIASGLEDAANKVLLLTYDSEMFSCYSTGKGEECKGEDGQKIAEINMNGIPLGIDVNYYYQSEMEYLFHGNRADAIKNLKAVAGLLFLVRFVFNYVASFSIPSVRNTVAAIKGTLSWAGPFAIVVGELARLALALGESALDVGRLKGGSKVSLFKQGEHKTDTDNGWRFSIQGMTASAIKKATLTITEETDDDSNGMRYKDYMRLFLLLIDGDVLAERTANLIEMNVTNKKQGIGGKGDRKAREQAMSEAELFKMADAVTDFSLTTTLDLRMIFLSMPFAQKGVNGKVPPGTLQITVTDYRGY